MHVMSKGNVFSSKEGIGEMEFGVQSPCITTVTSYLASYTRGVPRFPVILSRLSPLAP
jgi:hypothetical protein